MRKTNTKFNHFTTLQLLIIVQVAVITKCKQGAEIMPCNTQFLPDLNN